MLSVVIAPKYLRATHFSDGFASVANHDGRWSVIDSHGSQLFTVTTRNMTEVHEGAVSYWGPDGAVVSTVTGEVIAERLNELTRFSEGLAAVNPKGDDMRYVDLSGDPAFDARFTRGSHFSQGFAVVFRDRRYGVIDRTGSLVAPLESLDMCVAFRDGLCFAAWPTSGGYTAGYINTAGEKVIELPVEVGTDFERGVALVRLRNGNWHVIDREGRLVSEALPIATGAPFSEGLAPVQAGAEHGGRWGFIDSTGNFAIPPTFDRVSSFRAGYSQVLSQSRTGLLSADGSVTWSDELDWSDSALED